MIHINRKRCNGCRQLPEGPRCRDICPGDLYYQDEHQKACMHDPSECWDCCACVKACPRAALSIELPFQINDSRTQLYARHKKDDTVWEIRHHDNSLARRIIVPSRHTNANSPDPASNKDT
jgi:adenylylsulfate reductase subunit B